MKKEDDPRGMEDSGRRMWGEEKRVRDGERRARSHAHTTARPHELMETQDMENDCMADRWIGAG